MTILLTPELRSLLPPLYSQDGKGDAAIAYVKITHPLIDWIWYLTEFDGEDLCFGLVQGYAEELGYISLSELASVDAQVDTDFPPTPLGQLRKNSYAS